MLSLTIFAVAASAAAQRAPAATTAPTDPPIAEWPGRGADDAAKTSHAPGPYFKQH